MKINTGKSLFLAFCISITTGIVFIENANASTNEEIEMKVDMAMEKFLDEVNGAESLLSDAKGFLVLPGIIKAGFHIGGEYGQGALIIGDEIVDYYNIKSVSFGFQIGVQKRTVILAFMTDESLQKFRTSKGWDVGIDGSVSLINVGAGKDISTMNTKKPIVGIIFDIKGLMVNLTLEGSKISKL